MPDRPSRTQDIVKLPARFRIYRAHEAEDLTWDTFLKAFEGRSGFRGEASVRTWLCRIAVNTYLAAKRKDGRVTLVGRVVECMQDFLESPEHLVVRGEFLQCIHYLLQYECRPPERVILVMRDVNGLSYEEMSQVLGITLGAVKTRLHRARRAFRDLLVQEGCAAIVASGRCICEGVQDL